MQPLQIPPKSPSILSDESGGGDGFTYCNMMQMMMMQNHMDLEHREWEYQLHCDEMVMVRNKAREKRNTMNLMFMA